MPDRCWKGCPPQGLTATHRPSEGHEIASGAEPSSIVTGADHPIGAAALAVAAPAESRPAREESMSAHTTGTHARARRGADAAVVVRLLVKFVAVESLREALALQTRGSGRGCAVARSRTVCTCSIGGLAMTPHDSVLERRCVSEPSGSVVSVNVGLSRPVTWRGATVSPAIFESPVDGLVRCGPLGLAGDGQADLSVHGGVDKAVYAYPSEHYRWWWDQAAPVPRAWGAFGENLTAVSVFELTRLAVDAGAQERPAIETVLQSSVLTAPWREQLEGRLEWLGRRASRLADEGA